ncbi:MAG: twin-arginine translocation pathway signal protein [Candidatus Competibacteraceae bacterium]|nr:twin-arginine translocation pathway signal protein [Candidatus Competibacteraceae bacterium]MCB1808141.1 twin-arginine translocation pathway signal protein [Candidatus Competibacteraceae bacterium]MCB1811484.1 twin-arginine translocation pathway signal protein [Candidatus Competibacteraceae bacterium]
MKRNNPAYFWVATLATLVVLFSTLAASAETAAQIDRDVDSAIAKLYAESAAATELSKTAKGILVFPNVIKGGLIIGGQYGEGALRVGSEVAGYYSIAAASYGLQAGAQSFGYAMFFMTENALAYLEESAGWEVGVGPSVVVVDEGLARSISTTTVTEDVYVFFFSQKGLMAGLGIQGSKITKFDPEK